MKTILYYFLSWTLATSTGFASTGLKELLQVYLYEVTVTWDQKDPEVLKAYEKKLIQDIDYLLQAGKNHYELIETSIELIPDRILKNQIQQAWQLYQLEKMSKEELVYLITQNLNSLGAQGASWHPVTKVLVGGAVAYVVLHLIMMAIYYSDTDPEYGQATGGNPPKP